MVSSHSPEQEVLPANLEYLQEQWLAYAAVAFQLALDEKNFIELERALLFSRAAYGHVASQEKVAVQYAEEVHYYAIQLYLSIISLEIEEVSGQRVTPHNAEKLAMHAFKGYYIFTLNRFPFPEEVASVIRESGSKKIIRTEELLEWQYQKELRQMHDFIVDTSSRPSGQIIKLPERHPSIVVTEVLSAHTSLTEVDTEKIISHEVFSASSKQASVINGRAHTLSVKEENRLNNSEISRRKSNVQVVSAPVQPGPTEKIISFAAHRKRA